MDIFFAGENFTLTSERALIHKKNKAAFIADLHLGKSSHFRKAGIAIPTELTKIDLDSIGKLLILYEVEQLFFLGDLFHSKHNREWFLFEEFISSFPLIEFILIKGNHDVLLPEIYEKSKLQVVEEPYSWNGIQLSHHPVEETASVKSDLIFNIAGHLHPGVMVRGKGRQNIKLPSYLVSENQIILPAFGRFTGAVIDKSRKDFQHYAILDSKVVRII